MDAHRQRLLRDMGVERWLLRAPPGATTQAGAAGPLETDAPARPSDALGQAPARPGKEVAPNGRSQSNAPSAAETAPAFAIVVLGLPGTLLAVSAFPPRSGAAQLAQDLLRAARRDWAAAMRQVRFDWPLPGAQGTFRPALTAFLEKQIQDFAAQRLLATESVARRLKDAPLQLIVIPELQALADDPDAKRKLWQRLQALA